MERDNRQQHRDRDYIRTRTLRSLLHSCPNQERKGRKEGKQRHDIRTLHPGPSPTIRKHSSIVSRRRERNIACDGNAEYSDGLNASISSV